MDQKTPTSHQVSASESADNKRTTPKIFLAMMGVGVVAIGAVLSFGAKLVFH